MPNLIEGLLEQMNRCRELATEYDRIGPPGVIGATLIRQTIKDAEAAISSGDIVAELLCYDRLKGHE